MGRDLETLHGVLSGSHDLVLLLQSPIVKADKKQAVLDAVFGDHLGELTTSFLKILVTKGREGLVVDMVAAIGVDAMAAQEPGPEAFAAMMRMQALSGLVNLLQLCGFVLIIAAICRAVLWPERTPGRIFDLRVGMDEARVAVACVALMIGCYGVLFVILLLAFAFGAALWMVSEAAAVSLGVIVGLAGLVGVAWAALRATAAKPVMNMMRRPGWRAAATRATSIPSAPGMTMSVSSRS